MLARLAFRNVRRAGRDYAIYFITVALGVALFYAFNAVRSQSVLFDALSADSERMLTLLSMLIGLFSGVVVCVLGFLVVYANRFLIRRRRREFGTYLLLGMSAGRVSRILLCETALVGLASLAAGLALGVAISQGLSFATAALMGTTMSKYRFIVSGEAIALTALCFAAIFALSALVDVLYIRRCKLVALLSAREANERGGIAHMSARIAGFVFSVVLLALAYWQLAINGMQMIDAHFWAATALMLAGTFLFFWSVGGAVIFALTHASGIYLKGIRMFTVRQIASKVNTAFVSMGVVCVLLFFALTTASVGMGLLELFAGNLQQTTRYDATIVASSTFFDNTDPEWQDEFTRYDGNMAACLASRASSWSTAVRESAQVDLWIANATFQQILEQIPNAARMQDADTLSRIGQTEVKVVSQSQYNATCSLIGQKGVRLARDEFAVDNTIVGFDELGRAMSNKNVALEVAGTALHGYGELQCVPLDTSAMSDVGLIIVVPNEVVDSLRSAGAFPYLSYLNVSYPSDRAQGDADLAATLAEASPLPEGSTPLTNSIEDQFHKDAWPLSNVYTGLAMTEQASGLRMVITFLALYIGFTMLVATAAVLAIQQLSETTDSLQRYRRLSDLGCDLCQIFGSLRTQTVVYFCAPIALAACHTACAVNVISSTLFMELGVDPSGLIGVAAGSIAGVYAIYLVATYLLSKSVVRSTKPYASGGFYRAGRGRVCSD
ncbi:MAG: FtsX-like permease family protein [Coriobacteriales bacterium]|nr:FtsX-like permease family protein [Coriobacteriales bacterium]